MFDTHALVDGGIVASEADDFGGSGPGGGGGGGTGGGGGAGVPLPATAWLLLAGLGGIGIAGSRRNPIA